MAKEKKQSRVNLDWYLVSVETIRKIAAVAVVLLLGGAAYWFYKYQTTNPSIKAERAVSDAESSLNQLASSKDFSTYRSDFDRAKAKLDEAKGLIGQSKWAEAESVATESQTISTVALGHMVGPKESDAQFLSIEGDVQFQKSSTSDWKKADARAPLFNGDWVKTGDGSSAELIFSNGSLYTVGPNALLEIYAMATPGSTKKQNTVQMTVGSVEINTSDDVSTVKTPSTQVVIKSESTAQVGVDPSAKSTQVVSLKGSASVSSSTGSAVELATGETVKASKEGALSPKKTFLSPPALLAPSDNQLFRGSADTKAALSWDNVPGAAQYQLQVSRSRLFAGLEINANRTTTSAVARVTQEGSYYWRVASIDANGEVGPFSTFRRFRVSGVGTTSSSTHADDHTPPTLVIERPFSVGAGNYIIKGKVEAGSTVFLNDSEVDTDTSGSFQKLVTLPRGVNNLVIKAVDAAGNENVQTEKIVVQEDE